jgi:hypothetical protein
MRISLKTLNIALIAVGLGGLATGVLAESRYYDPSNAAANQGMTTNFELYRTIGCPGQGLFEKTCVEEKGRARRQEGPRPHLPAARRRHPG